MMAVRASELRAWINTIPPNWEVNIADGGRALVATGPTEKFEITLKISNEPKPKKE